MHAASARWLLACWIFLTATVGAGAAIDGRRDLTPASVGRISTAAPSGPQGPSSTPPPLPVSVEAPTAGIDATLVPVGKTADGALEVPAFGTAGWYDQSARPGAVGSAVLAGHVDSRTGPDVFYGLRKLQPGDEVLVHLADGSTRRFLVDGREQTPKDALPVDRIFDHPATAMLRLITCGGTFNRSTGHYRANVIVYAHLAPTPGA